MSNPPHTQAGAAVATSRRGTILGSVGCCIDRHSRSLDRILDVDVTFKISVEVTH